jgi:hypothetical protein
MKISQPILKNSWNSVLVMCFLVCMGQLLTLLASDQLSDARTLNIFRVTHIAIAIGVMILLLLFRNSPRWTIRVSTVLFTVLNIPFAITTWEYHRVLQDSQDFWIPLAGFRLYYLVLGILNSGSYFVNFVLMNIFAIESLAIWYGMDLAHSPKVILGQEPWVSLVYFFVASALLFFRARDEKLIQKLSTETANIEAMKQVARIFLSLRDRANTPIQTLKISAELLKRRYPDAKSLSETIDASARRLTEMNRYLGDVESAIPWGNKELISEAEVFQWIQKNIPADHVEKTTKN